MVRLILNLLGGFRAELDTGEPIEIPGRKTQALLTFLSLPPGAAHPRDKLAALLWPDLAAATARANLRQVLFTLRQAPGLADLVRLDGDTVALDATSVDVDAAAFERAVRDAPAERLGDALASYGGDLLAGLRVQEPPYEEWLLAERERLRECAVDGLARLLAHQRSTGDLASAVQTGLRFLAMDPLQEPVHRSLMRHRSTVLDERIWLASRGNPFIVVETLRALGVVEAGETSALPIAPAVKDLITRQLERLSEAGRRVATAAAVIGREFEFELLPPAADLDEERTAEAVEELVRHRLVREVGGRFELVHDRVRQMLYEQILPPRRLVVHRRVAAALEAVYRADLTPHVTALATHYRLAGAWEQAASMLEHAGLAAAAHSAHMDAASLFEQALAAIDHLPDGEETLRRQCRVRFRLGYSLSQAGRFAESLERYEAAVRLAEPLGNDEYLSMARAGRASVAASLGRYGEARELAEETYAAAVAAADHGGQFWALIQLARIDHAVGDYERSADHSRSASACLTQVPSMAAVGPLAPPDVIWRDWLLLDLAMLGAFDEAAAIVAERMPYGGQQSGLAVNLRVVSASCIGVHHVARGDLERALAVLEPTAELSRRSDTLLQFGRGAAALACAYVLASRAPEAVMLLEPVHLRVAQAHYSYLAEELECALGVAYLHAGHLTDADRLLGQALRGARASGARGVEAEALRAMGEGASLRRAPDLELAARYLAEAQALADRLRMRPLGARCRLELCAVRRLQGRLEEARTLGARAYRDCREMRMGIWLTRAEAVMATLS